MWGPDGNGLRWRLFTCDEERIQLDELASLSPGFFGRLGEDYRATWNVERYHATRTGGIQRRAIEKGAGLLLTHERKNVLRYNMSHPLKALKI